MLGFLREGLVQTLGQPPSPSPMRPWECGMITLFGAMGGLMASAALLVFGLRVGDRWIAVAGGVSSAIFMVAVAVIGGAM